MSSTTSSLRVRWAAIGAAIAVSLGAGGIGLANAAKGSGDRPVYTAVEPCRLVDTRPNHGIGGRTAPLGPRDVYTVSARGNSGQCVGIPTDVVAVELNVTAIGASHNTHFTIWDDGARPNASSLNPAPGQPPTPNAVTTKLAGDGTFRVYNEAGSIHFLADLVGVYQHHHHDDRYYTKAQVDSTIADVEGQPGPQGATGPQGPAGPQGEPGTPAPTNLLPLASGSATSSTTCGWTVSSLFFRNVTGCSRPATGTYDVQLAHSGLGLNNLATAVTPKCDNLTTRVETPTTSPVTLRITFRHTSTQALTNCGFTFITFRSG